MNNIQIDSPSSPTVRVEVNLPLGDIMHSQSYINSELFAVTPLRDVTRERLLTCLLERSIQTMQNELDVENQVETSQGLSRTPHALSRVPWDFLFLFGLKASHEAHFLWAFWILPGPRKALFTF